MVTEAKLCHGDHINLFGSILSVTGYLGILDRITTTYDPACSQKQLILYESPKDGSPRNFYQNCVFEVQLLGKADPGLPIRYGWTIQLRHVVSGYYLSDTT